MAEGFYRLGKFAFLLALTLLYLPLTFQRPQNSNDCLKDHAAIRTESGKINCWHLRKCPVEYGLSFEYIPGKIYSAGIKIACVPCIQGKTYSDLEDYRQCSDCTQCKEHEVFTGQCQMGKDEILCAGRCQEGFFWSNTTYSCMSCSLCCTKGNYSGCTEACSQEFKINCTLEINATESSFINNTDDDRIPTTKDEDLIYKSSSKDKPEKSVGPVQVFFIVLVFMFVISSPVMLFIVHRNKSETQGINSRNTQGFCYDSYGMIPLGKLSTPSPERSLTTDDENQALNLLQGTDVPTNLDDSWRLQDQENDRGSTFLETADNLVLLTIKHIPQEKRLQICAMLDKEENFFRDYRLLGEELGMEKNEIDLLKEKSSPAFCILEKFQDKYLEVLCKALKEIGRKDIASVLELDRGS